MRGVNFGGWFSQVDCIEEKDPGGFPGLYGHMETFLGDNDFAKVVAWGFDHVRLPVDYFNFFTGPRLTPDEQAFSLLDLAVKGAQKFGLQLILDLHKCPGHDFHEGTKKEQAFFTDAKCREDAKIVWSYLAERYGSHPHVLLEILNEPVAPDARTWNSVKDEMFWHIRSHAPKSTIVVGSNRWNSAQEFAELTPLDDDRVLYSFHCYTPVVFTHQKAPWIPADFFHQERSWPGHYSAPADTQNKLPHEVGEWNKDRLYRSLEPALRFREKHKVPVACNEFGVFVQVRRAWQLQWMEDFTDILSQAGVGFSYWNYKNLDFGLISRGENLHQNLEQYQNQERLDQQLVDLLLR